MQLKFADGTLLPVVTTDYQQHNSFQGFDRQSLTVQVKTADIALDALDALVFNATKTASITIISDDGTVNPPFKGFTLPSGVIQVQKVALTDTAGNPTGATEQRYRFTQYQKTYLEQQADEQAAAINALGQQVVALSLGGASK